MRYLNYSALIVALAYIGALEAKLVAHFPMDLKSGMIEESITGQKIPVYGNFTPENVNGVVGQALRFDGYTSHVETKLDTSLWDITDQLTVSLWVATPSYPVIQLDTNTTEQCPIMTCLDADTKSGFGFFLGYDGKYSFSAYIGGWPVSINVNTPLTPYLWHNLTAIIDGKNKKATLYDNGKPVGSSKVVGSVSLENINLFIGQGPSSRMFGPFELISFNGLIDDISIWNESISLSDLESWTTTLKPNLDIPNSRFEDDNLRPRFHGMPAAGWTNECHGMYYSDGKYHLFFQKNANGPYMAHLHWGHLSSENLYDWREENIALAPGDWYDIKGCWSGCIFTDKEITGNLPNILYTSVDYSKASISQAYPKNEYLNTWNKDINNPIISGCPDGLSDDFRDPYFFRNDNDAYIIAGSSHNGVGTTTLHKYNRNSKTWSNDGQLFYSGNLVATDGRFWEMPNITKMPNGKWIFTTTPLDTKFGVRTLYWTGNINSDGTFAPDIYSISPRLVELNSKEGFGLLSPTIYTHDDKVIALGIVPDKLPAEINWKLGWAHCYSLPREWRLDDAGNLLQKPYSGLCGLRTDINIRNTDFMLNGSLPLYNINSRSAEILANFEVNSSDFGFNIFKSPSSMGSIYYKASTGEIVADFSTLNRIPNDEGIYDGIYKCPLPARPMNGDLIKLNIYIDHSIIDIFINDKWATSIRVFPTDEDANLIEVFATSPVFVKSLEAWTLNPNTDGAGIIKATIDKSNKDKEYVDVYNLQGIRVRTHVKYNQATDLLPKGIYIVNYDQVLVD